MIIKRNYKGGFSLSITFALSLIMLINLDSSAQNLAQTIKGQVVDVDLQISLPGATVVILGSDPLIGVTTDIDGYFRLENVVLGRYDLKISYIGYDPYIISVRKAEHYAKGHIPGAVNIGFGDLFKAETLATLPQDQQIVVYCYTGHTGSQATAILGALGYDVVNLLHGMSAWTTDEEIAPSRFNPDTDRNDYSFETEANEATETYSFPILENTASADEAEVVRAAASSYTSPKNTTAGDLYLLLNDGEEDNDPFIVSVRKAEDYAKGHIPGAINIPVDDIKGPTEELAALGRTVRTVIYCRTGARSVTAAAALLEMDFGNVLNLLGGIEGWPGATELPDCGCG